MEAKGLNKYMHGFGASNENKDVKLIYNIIKINKVRWIK